MKTSSLLLSMLFLTYAPMGAIAQHDHEAHATTPAVPDQAALTDGEIKKVDKAAGKVTIAHGPMPSGMPAMTMAFRVKDAAWLDRLTEGQKIRFDAKTVDGALTIIYFEPAK
ncbi:MAG: copper-binding protein [Gammaproteobacteria bacterium]|nr:copper-binding protein [Gammaproteobacteria bacterium]